MLLHHLLKLMEYNYQYPTISVTSRTIIPLRLHVPQFMKHARNFCHPLSISVTPKIRLPLHLLPTMIPIHLPVPDHLMKKSKKEAVYTLEYEKYKHLLEEAHIISPSEMETNIAIPLSQNEDCPCNYDGSPGSVEISGMKWMTKRFHIVMGVCMYYAYIFSDDDTCIMKHLIHPEIRPTRKTHIGGYLF